MNLEKELRKVYWQFDGVLSSKANENHPHYPFFVFTAQSPMGQYLQLKLEMEENKADISCKIYLQVTGVVKGWIFKSYEFESDWGLNLEYVSNYAWRYRQNPRRFVNEKRRQK